jgi:membrane-associated phospholipid phosphatase
VASGDLGAGPVARAALDGLAAAIGMSRVYVGVHFPSDVAGGILLGKAVAAAFDGDRR